MDDDFSVEEVFNSAVSIVRNLPKEGSIRPSDELKLKLYAFYKQATHGPNDTPSPRFYQIVEAYKWNAWLKLADMTKEEAMLNYIRELKQVMQTVPNDDTDPESAKHFEDILGKKFYDYWFKQWEQSQTGVKRVLDYSNRDKESLQEARMAAKNNDTHSNSSGGSSMSMLEETSVKQVLSDSDHPSVEEEEYSDTLTMGVHSKIGGEMSVGESAKGQFASALLRLQIDLDATNRRLNGLESKLDAALSSKPRNERVKGTEARRDRLLSRDNMYTLIYLSWPLVVFLTMRAIERRSLARK